MEVCWHYVPIRVFRDRSTALRSWANVVIVMLPALEAQDSEVGSRAGIGPTVRQVRDYFFFEALACASALAAMLFVRGDDRPSVKAFDALVATFALVVFLLDDVGICSSFLWPETSAPRYTSPRIALSGAGPIGVPAR